MNQDLKYKNNKDSFGENYTDDGINNSQNKIKKLIIIVLISVIIILGGIYLLGHFSTQNQIQEINQVQ